jgi:hypothetical protein
MTSALGRLGKRDTPAPIRNEGTEVPVRRERVLKDPPSRTSVASPAAFARRTGRAGKSHDYDPWGLLMPGRTFGRGLPNGIQITRLQGTERIRVPMTTARTALRASTKRDPTRPSRRAARARKNMDMDPAKLAAARRALGTATDTETVDRALDLAIGRARFDAAMDRITARGGLNAYDRTA